MPKNKIQDLRNHLFETLEKLLDEEDPMDEQQALAIAKIGKVIVDSAKVEVQFMNIVGGLGSGFIPSEPNELDDKITAKQLREDNQKVM